MKRKKYNGWGKQRTDSRFRPVSTVSGLASIAAGARMQDDETVKGLLRAVHFADDPELAMDAAEYIEARVFEYILEPDPFAPPVHPQQAWGEIQLGVIENSRCIFGLTPQELVQHALVVGRSGAGKTTLITRMIKQVLSLDRTMTPAPRIMIFDIKRDYGILAVHYPEVWKFTVPGPDFRWNPLEPPINDWKKWGGIFASVTANSCGFYGGASTENLLYRSVLELYLRYNVERGTYPCLLDLRDYLNWMRITKKVERYSEEFNWFVRVKNRVESLCNSFGDTVECSSGYPLPDLLDNDIIFEIDGLKPDAQAFFTEMFINMVIRHRMEREESGGVLRNLVVLDEGKRHMPKYKENAQNSISNINFNMAMGREFGIGFVVGDCDPAQLANCVKSSCYARFFFNQTHGEDVMDSIKSLGLDFEQSAEIQKLDVGEAIVRLAGRIKRPFLLKVIK